MSCATDSFDITFIFCFAEIACMDIPDKVKGYRLEALNKVRGLMNYYKGLGYTDKLLIPIAEKKCEFIKQVTTKADIKQLSEPHAPHYDGNKFITGRFHIPEEELIAWSQTSLKGPLNSVGYNRYQELFKQVYPEHTDIFKN